MKFAAQITAKLAHYEKKREVAYARLPTDAQENARKKLFAYP